ncbi:hypothetical protein CHUAL_004654 [Chamberlinius hualienensis]
MNRVLAGPFCAMILGDLGAEVIKVEQQGKGDDTRRFGPPFIKDESCYFLAINRNKKSITVDIKKKEGADIVRKLVTKSDILIENYLPGNLDKVGLGYEQIKQLAPGVIYCSISGFGSTGPYRSKPGYDVAAAALGGLLHMTGPIDGEPCKVGVAITDLTTGLYAHGAILAALLRRQQTGLGQRIECNLLSTQMATLINIGSNYLNYGMEAKRWGTESESIVPYKAFKTADGYVVIGAGNDEQFKDMCQRMDLVNVINDSRFKTNELRVMNRDSLSKILNDSFIQKTNEDWLKCFTGSRCPIAPVNSMQQAFNDPQVIHNKTVVELSHPTIGNVKVVGPAVKYEEGGNFCRSAPPILGQHTDQVLKEILEMDNTEIENLKKLKAI